ncbi:MAG TPA: hypothetical protein VEZ16_00185 [Microvirga sp.]|nr:hypothetical protein [Microvirga sp.]
MYAFSGNELNPPKHPQSQAERVAHYTALTKRLVLINTHLVALYSSLRTIDGAVIPKMLATPHLLISSSDFDMTNMGWGGMARNVALDRLMLAPLLDPPQGAERLADPIYSRQSTISAEVIAASIDLFEAITTHELAILPELIDLLLRAAVAFETHDFPASLITSWAVTEKLGNVQWDRFLKDKKFNKRRRELLLDSRTYSAAVRLEVLELSGFISEDLYTRTNDIRRARNNWIHSLARIESDDANDALFAALDWVSLVSGIRINLPVLRSFGAI